MIKYVIRRCLSIILVIFAATFVIFTITYFAPGDPAMSLLGSDVTHEEIQNLRHVLGIDRPYMEQLLTYLYDVYIRFDFGESWLYQVPVFDEMWSRMPYTLAVGLASMFLNVTLGLSLGVFAGVHEGKWQDTFTMGIAMFLASAPGFWVSLMMIIFFAVELEWLPPYGIGSFAHYILPVVSGSLGGIAINARFGRNSILEVLRADYITTARAKGQSEKLVIWKHMLPNALMPIITNMGGILSRIVTGSVITENVFSIPGVGLYMLNGVNFRDYPVIRGCVLFFAAFTSVVMLLTDLCYAMIDPRIKAQYSSGRKVK